MALSNGSDDVVRFSTSFEMEDEPAVVEERPELTMTGEGDDSSFFSSGEIGSRLDDADGGDNELGGIGTAEMDEVVEVEEIDEEISIETPDDADEVGVGLDPPERMDSE